MCDRHIFRLLAPGAQRGFLSAIYLRLAPTIGNYAVEEQELAEYFPTACFLCKWNVLTINGGIGGSIVPLEQTLEFVTTAAADSYCVTAG